MTSVARGALPPGKTRWRGWFRFSFSGLWFRVFCSLTLKLSEFSIFLFRAITKKIPLRALGSLFPLSFSLFVPIIFPGNGDLWGSYGRGLPTLSNVTFLIRKKQQPFNAQV